MLTKEIVLWYDIYRKKEISSLFSISNLDLIHENYFKKKVRPACLTFFNRYVDLIIFDNQIYKYQFKQLKYIFHENHFLSVPFMERRNKFQKMEHTYFTTYKNLVNSFDKTRHSKIWKIQTFTNELG